MKSTTGKIALTVAVIAAATIIAGIFFLSGNKPKEISKSDPLLPYIKKDAKWTSEDFNDFIDNLNAERRHNLKLVLKMDAKKDHGSIEAFEIRKKFLWESSNILTYPVKNENKVNYHGTVQWVAGKLGIDKKIVDSENSFTLERMILEKSFANMWDKLSKEDRKKLLDKIDQDGKIQNKAAIIAGSGAVAVGGLATAVGVGGFAFYTTMSSAICTAAGMAGVTLPFATYTGAASTVAVLSGPIGWAIAGTGALACTAFAGRADVQDTTAAIIQIHMTKVEALQKSGVKLE